MFKPVNRDQNCFLPPSLKSCVPVNDIIHTIIEIAEKLDTTKVESKYDVLGQNAYHPKMMIEILFYAYSQGVFSSREIEENLKFDLRYMYLAGMHKPCFNRICQFRRDHLEDIRELFVQIVRICQDKGLTPLKSVSIDGTKLGSSD